ncbi:Sas10 C-terminal domain containing protein [Nitzschia inconspicua]|uniref:Sas10 C-terminal domain containing protein n=1 Tax=Nitzschia inconspicua TaxID=303405 RepID=A0A9K3PWZ0_9STRA|nr:Sas10 C-terminal domain containing protein [Nitzschia inconspicua]
MGKRRNTAKTGDKALYKGRPKSDGFSTRANNDDDDMYNEIDRYHNERDQEEYIGFDGEDNGDNDDKDLTGNKESVLDLGIGDDESSDDDDDDSSSTEVHRHTETTRTGSDTDNSEFSSGTSSGSDSDSDEDGIEDLKEQLKAVSDDPRKWGKKKAMYYHGDTADLEIGQEEEDAFLEEEAAKEIQASRFQEMDEEDFVLSEDEDDVVARKDKATMANAESMATSRDISKLSRNEARKLLQKQHPEILPMLSYFADVANDLRDRTDVAVYALMKGDGTAESVGTTIQGQQYLLTKAMLQKSTALNAVVYLLLKSTSTADEDGNDSISAHPVTDQLKCLFKALEKLKEKVESKIPGLDEQLDTIVKAASMLNSGQASHDEDTSDSESSKDDSQKTEDRAEQTNPDQNGLDDSDVLGEEDEEEIAAQTSGLKDRKPKRTLNEARFGLRPDESGKSSSKVSKKRSFNYADDFGDLDEAPAAAKMLSSTINSIEQRSQVASRKRRPAPVSEQLDDPNENDDRVAEGIKMMEEELGKIDAEENDSADESTSRADLDFEDAPDANDRALNFYETMAEKKKSKKEFKKSLYQVTPKFPRGDALVDGERAISMAILKNRGLVAHKAKINRNPRVKKREQYRKALIRRKGAVREVREGESHKYGGEGTGIKSGISRSRKLSFK